jgi:hypothetical protein
MNSGGLATVAGKHDVAGAIDRPASLMKAEGSMVNGTKLSSRIVVFDRSV